MSSPLTSAGWGNNFRSESIPNSLPKQGHNPQDPPYGLYTEGVTGSAFTAPRAKNKRSWLYRVRPSVVHEAYEPYEGNQGIISDFSRHNPEIVVTPQQMRWDPFTVKGARGLDFVDGLRTIGGCGDPQNKDGVAYHFYEFGRDMNKRALYNADGSFLFLPTKGELLLTTEFGKMHVPPGFLAVIPRSLKVTVARVGSDAEADETATGYVIENYRGNFELPELGPIGGNGLANLEDFETPRAAYEDADEEWQTIAKFGGSLWQYTQDHSPYDVVAWMGNYYPYRYDMNKFNTMGALNYDHPDPSISALLTVPSEQPGTAVFDLLCFGPRWQAVSNTFRPQWFHRNIMPEFMVTIKGYPSPKDGANLHNVSSAHGPSSDVTNAANTIPPGPMWVGDGGIICLMESYLPMNLTKWALGDRLQKDYHRAMWQDIKRHHSLPAKSHGASSRVISS